MAWPASSSSLPTPISVEDVLALASLYNPPTPDNLQGELRNKEVIALARAVAEIINGVNSSLIAADRQL